MGLGATRLKTPEDIRRDQIAHARQLLAHEDKMQREIKEGARQFVDAAFERKEPPRSGLVELPKSEELEEMGKPKQTLTSFVRERLHQPTAAIFTAARAAGITLRNGKPVTLKKIQQCLWAIEHTKSAKTRARQTKVTLKAKLRPEPAPAPAPKPTSMPELALAILKDASLSPAKKVALLSVYTEHA
jgi:hypothetical protein